MGGIVLRLAGLVELTGPLELTVLLELTGLAVAIESISNKLGSAVETSALFDSVSFDFFDSASSFDAFDLASFDL